MKILSRDFLDSKTDTCHAATISFYRDEPVFAWFGGTQEGNTDSSIYIQFKNEILCIGENHSVAYWNPILFTVDNKGEEELFLAYKRGEFCDRWQTYISNLSSIGDKDIKVPKPQIIPAGLNFCVKTKPVFDSNRHIICGSSVETKDDWTSYIETYDYYNGEFILDSRSKPLTVPKHKFVYHHPYHGKVSQITSGIIQPSLWFDKNNILHAFFRSSRGLGKVYHSQKNRSDYAVDWCMPHPIEHLDNPNSGIDTLYINEKLYLVHNPSDTFRHPLVLSELNNDFEVVDQIEIQYETKGGTSTKELSYPYMVENEGKIHLVYTYGRVKIEYVTIEL